MGCINAIDAVKKGAQLSVQGYEGAVVKSMSAVGTHTGMQVLRIHPRDLPWDLPAVFS